MGTTTYTQPFKQGFAHAPTTNTTTAPAVSKPWYASLDSLPESGKFNGGNIDIPSQHRTSDDRQPTSPPQAQMRTRRFSNAEIERVIEEELEIADDIPAPWPLEFEEASPPNRNHHRSPTIAIPVTDLRNHHGRRISHIELPSPKSPPKTTKPPVNNPSHPQAKDSPTSPTQQHHPHPTGRGRDHYPRFNPPTTTTTTLNPNIQPPTQEASTPRPPKAIRKATRQEQDPLQFPLEVEAPSQVEKAGAWCTASSCPSGTAAALPARGGASAGGGRGRGSGRKGSAGADTRMQEGEGEEGQEGEGGEGGDEDEGGNGMRHGRGRKDSGAGPTTTATPVTLANCGGVDGDDLPRGGLRRHCDRADAQVVSGGAGPTRCFCGLSWAGETASGDRMRRRGGGGGGRGRLDW
ncbi:hypothetical protein D0862_14602 [Hortaea werneckii]|uniref:Uncharacterized protein n=1 Tax=Hortaea werneckii TaxID=91943 RepID=A0A3M7E453_HORWE|nr:hypothetical protein D0862_14602 [Hortaea werneckii]